MQKEKPIFCPIETAAAFVKSAQETARPYGGDGHTNPDAIQRIEEELIKSNIKLLNDTGHPVARSAAAYAAYIFG